MPGLADLIAQNYQQYGLTDTLPGWETPEARQQSAAYVTAHPDDFKFVNGRLVPASYPEEAGTPPAPAPAPEPPPAPAPPPQQGLPALIPPAQAYGNFIAGPGFQLPDSDAAMRGLRALQTQAVGGYSDLLTADPSTQRQAIQDAMYRTQSEGITRDASDLFRRLNEQTFARGVGQSSISTDNIGRLARETNDSLARAGLNAFIGAGSEQRADQASRLAALGAAFNAGTGGLQGEANVGLTNAGRQQQARQTGLSTALTESEAAANRAQQAGQFQQGMDLQERALDINERNAQLAAIGTGLGGLAAIFGPTLNAGAGDLNNWLRTVLNLGTTTPPAGG